MAIALAAPGGTSPSGVDAGRDALGEEAQAHRRLFGGAEGVLGAHREAVHVRAVEARHVDLGAHVLGEHAAEGGGERDLFGAERGGGDRGVPARLGVVAVQHLEELALLHGAPSASGGGASS